METTVVSCTVHTCDVLQQQKQQMENFPFFLTVLCCAVLQHALCGRAVMAIQVR